MVESSFQKISLSESKSVNNSQKTSKLGLKRLNKIIGFSILGLLIIVLIIAISTMVLAMPLVVGLKKTTALGQETYQAAKTQDLITAEKKIQETHQAIKDMRSSYRRLFWLKFTPVLSIYYQDGNNVLEAAEAGIEGGQTLIEALTPYADVLGLKGKGSFTGGTAQDRVIKIIQTLSEVTPKMGLVKDKLVLAKESLDKIDPNHYPKTIKGKNIREEIIKIKNLADTAVTAVTDIQPTLEVLPQFLGYPNPQKYLVIMQNDGELRATGGFMTAYAILKIEGGKIIPEKSDDIYSLDKKNKNKVKAPEAIEKYLLSADLKTGLVPYWYLRDMNLSPDFKVSMETFKKYYDQLPNESYIDGIIAIDTKVLKDLLTILGPVEVAEYGKFTMDKDSRCHDIPQVICEMEYIVGAPLPTMKAERKAILGPLMKSIVSKFFDSPSELWSSIFKVTVADIQQKHILFFFSDEKMQHAAEVLNAAGRIKEAKGDYLHINDTNFGGAKSNLFVQTSVEQTIEVKENNKIVKTLTLTYTNPEPMDNCNLERTKGLCLNGILRDYVRIYVPKGSKLIEGIGSDSEFKTYEELDKTIFEGFFTLRGGGGRAKVVVTYELPFSFEKQKDYDLLIQKQPGTNNNHYLTIFGDKKEEFDLLTDKDLKF